MIDKSAEAAEDPDYVLTVERRRAPSRPSTARSPPAAGCCCARAGTPGPTTRTRSSTRTTTGPHTPGFDAECARWLAEETPARRRRRETVGTDAGAAHSFDPPFPVHHFVLGAGRYGLTQLANLAQLPPTGALLIVAPLKLVGGTGSPARVLALVPRSPAADPG